MRCFVSEKVLFCQHYRFFLFFHREQVPCFFRIDGQVLAALGYKDLTFVIKVVD